MIDTLKEMEKKHIRMLSKVKIVLLFFVTISFSNTQINISGIVQDRNTKKPIAGAKVTLFSLKIKTTTDTSGKFTISGTSILSSNYKKQIGKTLFGSIIYIQEKSENVLIRIFDLSGRYIKTLFYGLLEKGVWQIVPPPLSDGIYIVMFSTHQDNRVVHLVSSLNNRGATFATQTKLRNVLDISKVAITEDKTQTPSPVDSLQVTKDGYHSAIIPIESYQISGLSILLEDSTTSTFDDVTIVPDPSWTCFMPEGIPPPQSGEAVFKIIMQYNTIHKVGTTKFGYRRQINISGGSINGSKITGTIVSGGLDYELTLSNGAMEVEQIVILRSANTYILMRNAGVAPSGAKYARMVLDFEVPNSSSINWLQNGKFIANRIIDTVSKTITLDVYDVTNVSLTENRVQIKDPPNVPNQTWECLKLSGSQGTVVFTENVTLGSSISIGTTKRGSRNIIPITGGTTSGRVKGKILAVGADYQLSGSLDARYTILTDDSEYIIIRNCGSGTLIPVFETRVDGPYAFLNENKYISSAPGMGSGGVSITFYELK